MAVNNIIFLEAVGIINDHLDGLPRRKIIRYQQKIKKRRIKPFENHIYGAVSF